MPSVSPERSNWRDEGLSKRHREWGWDCPAVDIDFLMLEYDKGEPVMLVEYKHENATAQTPNHPSFRAISVMATCAKMPFVAVRYADDYSWWLVVPLNDLANDVLVTRQRMTEKEYVTFLYTMRGREMPDLEIFDT